MSMQALSDVFEDRIISNGTWPMHSPDLNPCEFFFWGCLEDKVYNSNPWMEEPKENIHWEIANIPTEQLQRVNQNLFCQCEECLHVEGQHFQHLLWSVNKGKNFSSFWMLSTARHADLLARFIYASQQLLHQPPWSTELRNRSTE
jgi:hypothetical protein